MLKMLLFKPSPNPARFSVLLGHIIGVSLRSKPLGKRKEADKGTPDGKKLVEENRVRQCKHPCFLLIIKQDSIISFYSTHILSSKIAISHHILVRQLRLDLLL